MKNKVFSFITILCVLLTILFDPSHSFAATTETLSSLDQNRWIVVVDSNRDLYKVKMDGSEKTKLFGPIGEAGDRIDHLTISENGDKVVATIVSSEQNFIYVVDLKKNEANKIAKIDKEFSYWYMNISKCSEYVSFAVNFHGKRRAYIIRSNGEELRTISVGSNENCYCPSISNDGKSIAFISYSSSLFSTHYSLYIADLSLTNAKKISGSTKSHHNPEFSYDDESVFCIIDNELVERFQNSVAKYSFSDILRYLNE